MEYSIYRKYGIDPNRTPTDAEVEIVSFCFGVSREEALSILSARKLNTPLRFASGASVNGNEAKAKKQGEW